MIQDAYRVVKADFKEFTFIWITLDSQEYFKAAVDEGICPVFDLSADSRRQGHHVPSFALVNCMPDGVDVFFREILCMK